MGVYLNIAQIIVSIALILVILVQAKGNSFNTSFQADASVFRTRRGLEKTLFQLALGLSGVFIVLAILNVVLVSRGA